VLDCEAGEAVRYHPDAKAAMDFATRAESQGKRERAAKARQGITAYPGRNPALTGKRLEKAKALWADPTTTAQQVADAMGAKVRTLYRYLGSKGTPKFGRLPRK
jgi:hypothetical protein